jgi:hypothetical protein
VRVRNIRPTASMKKTSASARRMYFVAKGLPS